MPEQISTKNASSNRHFFTYAGALIVFTTFIVRDNIRDHLRDTISKVDTARAEFVTDKQFQDNHELLMILAQATLHTQEADHTVKGQLVKSLQRSQDEINSLSGLTNAIGDKNLIADLDIIQKHIDEVSDKLRNINEKDEDALEKAVSLEQAVSTIDNTTTFIGWHIIEEGHKKSIAEERYYTTANWASCILYVLGWGLGLFGRLKGFDTGTGE